MREWLMIVTGYSVLIIDAMATLIIVVGTVEAFVAGLRLVFAPRSNRDPHDVWLRYLRWLTAGLTFQLAADILETSIRTSWQSIGQLGAIAVIRTFLNFFLERDLEATRKRHREEEPAPARRP